MRIQRWQIIKAMLVVAVCASLGGAYAMAKAPEVKLWECGKCKQQRWEEGRPGVNGCPKGGGHSWTAKRVK